ncbi:acyl carrier protein [Leptospira ellisii]|uniref:Uncharacterized protein n=1 Tax=Leptospira ellisii TaxID=2023197 RepID=A0A2N0B545_9LEPT|nr:hypothetical protein CH379_17550 [Leptospira ellisii]PKA05199.1 hypothetical protein CH375_06475 [Leptospira ellisii]
MDNFQRIKRTVSQLLAIDESEISELSGPGDLKGWDSANHLKIIMAIESEFNVEFDPDEFTQMVNLGVIAAILESKI